MSSSSELLLETARRGDIHHALILHGPAEEMLMQTAVGIARALNCLSGSTGDDCAACIKIDKAVHPDVHILTVGEERKMIGIEQVRTTIAEAAMRPYEGRRKVFIIDGAETMSGAAANSLLKTLEEPTAGTVFILLTPLPDLLLPTIRSRCQMVPIRPAARFEARAEAERRRIPIGLARIRRDSSDPDEGESTAREIAALLAEFATKHDLGALLKIAPLLTGADDLRSAYSTFLAMLRDLTALAPDDSVDAAAFEAIQKAIPRERILEAATLGLAGWNQMNVNADPRLLIERSLLALASQ
jgi:DNA polymerase III gamma/tau subunit